MGGKLACELAVGILTGGISAASGRLAKQLADLPGLMRKIDDWLTRRNNGGDGNDGGEEVDTDAGPGTCAAPSSFPTGTEVLLADGARRPIELVRPGDMVFAFDPDDGSWAPRTVLNQWSYLDTDEMATLNLTDGSTVTATDHHRFWSSSSRTFREAEQLTPGEQLVTPKGTVLVGAVFVEPSAPTLVWELTVAVDHTFAVFAGDNAIAVHNQVCVTPIKARALLREALGTCQFVVKCQAHHLFGVVEHGSPLGKKLQGWGIDLNGQENGVWLPSEPVAGYEGAIHNGRHLTSYGDAVRNRLADATNRDDALAILAGIRKDLINGDLRLNNPK